jgi:proteasome assembly chaperone (PAC2) family protein
VSGNDNVKFNSRPDLQSPYIVCGLNGSFNGGNVSIGGVDYLINQFNGVKFAEMPASHYHIYQIPGVESLRPVFKMEDGLIEESHLPENEFYYSKNTGSEHDLILFVGNEPSLNWEEYSDTVINLAGDFGATRLYALCGILDMTPYTREPKISCTCTDAKVREEMGKFSVTFSSREGPASFGQMLLYACKKKGLEGVNFTVRVPCYPEYNVYLGYSPKSLKAVLIRMKDIMHLDVNFDELDSAIEEVEGKLNFVRQQNPQFNTFLEELEKDYEEMPYEESLDISPSDAVRLAEEFLENNQD